MKKLVQNFQGVNFTAHNFSIYDSILETLLEGTPGRQLSFWAVLQMVYSCQYGVSKSKSGLTTQNCQIAKIAKSGAF